MDCIYNKAEEESTWMFPLLLFYFITVIRTTQKPFLCTSQSRTFISHKTVTYCTILAIHTSKAPLKKYSIWQINNEVLPHLYMGQYSMPASN